MKLRDHIPQTIHTVGVDQTQSQKFSMRMNSKAIKIMSSTIYKYKIRAIIRELSCNAIDGHMVAGNMGCFDVQLPTVIDPRFVIRDYGTGLSDYMVREVFTVYFESTKTDTDDLIGAMGLGSKSPFCYYSQTFTVESVQNGVKRGYTAYMDENGEPFINILYEVETDEPDGVQITVPVDPEDVPEWEAEAARVYEAFTGIRPRFIGVQLDINWQPKPNEKKPNDTIWYKSKYYSGLYARMGNICYPIDLEMFENTLIHVYQDPNRVYIMDFPMGSLDFMPSREELSLDKITKKVIQDRLNGTNRIYLDRLIADFNKLKTPRNKLAWYQDLSHGLKTYLCRDPLFKVNDITLGDMDLMINSKDVLDLIHVGGYWANSYDGKACSFERTGSGSRYDKFKAETNNRQSAFRLLNAKEAKLYIIKPDMEKMKPYICGFVLKNQLQRVSFVAQYPHNSAQIEHLIKSGFYDESEVVYLKASEMLEEKAAYEEFTKRNREIMKTSPKDNEPKPKTPTAYRYTLGQNDTLQKESLFLTKADFVALDSAYAVRLFGVDEYSRLDGKPEKISTDEVMKSIREVLVNFQIKEVYAIRNNLWDKVPVSNMKCLDDLLADTFVKTVKAMKPNWYPATLAKKHWEPVRRMKTELNMTIEKMVKNRPDMKRYAILDLLDSKIVKDLVPNDKNGKTVVRDLALRDARAKHRAMQDDMRVRVDAEYTKFEELNPVVDYLVRHSNYSTARDLFHNKALRDDLIRNIRWK